MVRTTLVSLLTCTLCSIDAGAQSSGSGQRKAASLRAASLKVTLVTQKREYNVGDLWICKFKATVTAASNQPLTIRAWSQFFADYHVIPEFHGPLENSKLSDVLATGGQIWRDGAPVVLWNAPQAAVFSRASLMVVPSGASETTTFHHSFGGALKPGRFRKKLWFAIVVEPSPNQYMLLFSQKPTDIEFVADGDEIDFDTFTKQYDEWYTTKTVELHDEMPVVSKPASQSGDQGSKPPHRSEPMP